MHPKNRHNGRYDFSALTKSDGMLSQFVSKNQYGDESIDFAQPKAVKALNRALLKHFYKVSSWDIPENYLCPPIPGRADHIHHIAELAPVEKKVRVLDIGVGANLVYPIIGVQEYGWSFVGSDIDSVALRSAEAILEKNPDLKSSVELRLQKNSAHIFKDLIKKEEHFDLSICNPPFHSSLAEAEEGSRRKWKNLGKETPRNQAPVANFGGKNTELWYPGGEVAFIRKMIQESILFQKQCTWFSSLVSRDAHLPAVFGDLERAKVRESRVFEMNQGQKKSRIVAWTFL